MRKLNLTNQRFDKLLVLEPAESIKEGKTGRRGMSKCQCDCGGIIIVQNNSLTRGFTRSCGCIQKESARNAIKKVQQSNIKNTPYMGSAKTLWRSDYSDGLSFEDFLLKSQYNCLYCDASPSNKYVKQMYKSGSYNIDEASFIYNGLDRIDSTMDHGANNIVACCKYCNFAKLDRTIEEFRNYIISLTGHKIISPDEHRIFSMKIDISRIHTKENTSLLSMIKNVYRRRSSNYNDGTLSMNQFYQLSQCNCYYCGSMPSNIKIPQCKSIEKRNNGIFIYSGMDRLDNSRSHDYNNVVACCKYCNVAKNNRTINNFFDWINRLRDNIYNWQFLDMVA